MNRRGWIFATAAAGAAVAGAAWQARRNASLPAAAAPLDASTQAFWQANFTQPDGQLLAMASLRGAPLVLNFWATWCPPCVKEMPEIDRFARQFTAAGGRVVGLAVDSPSAVRQYLGRAPVSYTIGLAGFDGTELSRQLGNSSGALPFTAVFDKAGRIAQRKLGQTSFDELLLWSRQL